MQYHHKYYVYSYMAFAVAGMSVAALVYLIKEGLKDR